MADVWERNKGLPSVLRFICLFKAKTHCTVGLFTNVAGKCVTVVTQNGKGIEEFCSYISCEMK